MNELFHPTLFLLIFQLHFPVGRQSTQIFSRGVILPSAAEQTTQGQRLQERGMG